LNEISYLMPFSELKKKIQIVSDNGQLKVTMSYEAFIDIVRELLKPLPMDENFYKAMYPDVAEAIAAGIHRSAKDHFIENGYAEGRLPFLIKIDPDWYAAQNPDLREGLESGEIGSLEEHFIKHGYQEGRWPFDPHPPAEWNAG
jgi:hypothetical protein